MLKVVDNILNANKITVFIIFLVFLFFINFSIAACYLLFPILILSFVYSKWYLKQDVKLPIFFYLFLGFSVITLISTIFSINPQNSLNENKDLLIFLLIPVYILILNSKKRVEFSLYTILFSSLLSAIIGLFSIIKNGVSLSHRLKGLTSHWMTYSGLLMLTFMFFAILSFYEKDKFKKKLYISSNLFILFIIPLTLTRSVWLGIVLSLIAFLIYYNYRYFVFFVIGIVTVFIILPNNIKSRVFSIFDLKNESNKDRIYMYYTAVKIFKNYPLFGVGTDNVKDVYEEYKHPDLKKHPEPKKHPDLKKHTEPKKVQETKNIPPHLHNNFLQILAERGVFALITFILSFIYIFIDLVKNIKRRTDFTKYFSLSSMFVLISFLIAGLFEYNFGDSEVKFLLFFYIILGFVKLKEKDEGIKKETV